MDAATEDRMKVSAEVGASQGVKHGSRDESGMIDICMSQRHPDKGDCKIKRTIEKAVEPTQAVTIPVTVTLFLLSTTKGQA